MLFMCIVSIVLGGLTEAEVSTDFPVCNQTSQEFQGYTFRLDETDRIWSHCGFPNPIYERSRCGWPTTDTADVRYVCDPAGLLNEIDAQRIDMVLKDFQSNSSRQCNTQNIVGTMIVVKRVRLPDVKHQDACINKCGEIHPEMSVDDEPSNAELNAISANFADHVRRQWQLGNCDNDVVILYWHEFGQLYVSHGSSLQSYISEEKITGYTKQANDFIKQNVSSSQIAKGIEDMLQNYHQQLMLTSPSVILFILNFGILIVVVGFLVAFTNMSRKEYDMWGVELHWEIIGRIVYIISGLWFIELTFKGILWIQNQSALVVILFPCVLCAACVIGFLIYLIPSSSG